MNLANRAAARQREFEAALKTMEAAARQHAIRFPSLAHLFPKRKAQA